MTARISVLVADDHGLVRETLSAWLQVAPDIAVVATAANGKEAVARAEEFTPDVALLDIEMPGMDGFEVARLIKKSCPATRIVFLSAFHSDRYIDMALQLEASGYVVKSEPPATVASAIRAVAAGGVFFSPEVQERIVVDSSGLRLASSSDKSRLATLTPREFEILRHVARGLSNKDIAKAAEISVHTVERHIANLMARLDIHRRVELAQLALREGFAAV